MAFFFNQFNRDEEIVKYRSKLKDDLPEIHDPAAVHVRHELLDKIDQELDKDFSRVLLIKGIAGTGKSLLALDYAHRQMSGNKAIVRWFEAHSRASLEASLLNLASDIGIQSHFSTANLGTLLQAIGAKLSREINFKILFVFDGVADYKDVEFVPKLPEHVQVLVTSRNAEARGVASASITLEPFTLEESIRIASERLDPHRADSSSVKRLVKQLGGSRGFVLPKELIQALALFNRNDRLSLDEYLSSYHKEGCKLEKSLIADLVKTDDPEKRDAWTLLQHLAFLSPHNIGSEIVSGAGFPDYEQAVDKLRRLSLIDCCLRRSRRSQFKVHPKVQEIVIKHIDPHLAASVLMRLLEVTGRLMPLVSQDSSHEDRCVAAGYYEHLESVFRHLSARALPLHEPIVEDACEKLYNYNKFVTSDWKKALLYAKKLYSLGQPASLAASREGALKLARYLDGIGHCCFELSRRKGALVHFKRSLRIKLDNSHPGAKVDSVLDSLNYLGMVNCDLTNGPSSSLLLNHLRIAKKCYLRGLKLARTSPVSAFSSPHMRKRFVVRFYNNLLKVHHKLGDDRSERKIAMRGLRLMKRAFRDENHENFAIFLSNLANSYEKRGDVTKQKYCQTRALDIMRRIGNGVQRSTTSHILNNIGVLHLKLAEYEQAIDYLNQALEIDMALYPQQGSFRSVVLKNLGSVHMKMGDLRGGSREHRLDPPLGDLDVAIDFFRRSHDIRRDLQGSRSLEAANVLEDLGLALCKRGELAEGRRLILESLQIKDSIKDLKEIVKADAYYYLGLSCGLAGDWHGQVAHILTALDAIKFDRTFDRSEYHYALGEAYRNMHRFDLEIKSKKEAADILEGIELDHIHSSLQTYYQDIANAYGQLGKQDLAQIYEKKASAAKDDRHRRGLTVWSRYEKRNLPGRGTSKISGGAFGIVYLVEDKRERNLKALKEVMVRDKEKIDLEISILDELTRINPHENIIKMCDSFDDNGIGLSKYIVFEYCQDGSLSEYIANVEKREVSLSLRLMSQLASAIDHLHTSLPRIIHRDIKPQNVLLTNEGRTVKLIDFGISVRIPRDGFTCTGVEGTPGYVAPEIWPGNPYNESVDIWSFGCVMFETLLGSRYVASAANEPESNYANLPAGLASILRGTLCQSPGDRLTSTELVRALANQALQSN